MDDETIKLLITTCGAPAVIALCASALGAVWIYLTKVYVPSQQKRIEENAKQDYKVQDSREEFGEQQQGTALESQLGIVKQLISHIIESNNGHMTKLTESVVVGMAKITEAVIAGDREHTAQLEKMTAAYNQALVTLSRAAAFPYIQRHGESAGIDDILLARVKTEAVEVTDAIAAAARSDILTPPDTDISTIEVTGKKLGE